MIVPNNQMQPDQATRYARVLDLMTQRMEYNNHVYK